MKAWLLALLVALPASGAWAASAPARSADAAQENFLRAFSRTDPIDAHVHVYQTSAALQTFLEKYRLHFLDIAVLDQADPEFRDLQPQLDAIRKLAQDDPGHTALCTTFSPYDFADKGFTDRVIKQLDRDFAQGAVAVKFYKTVGMQIRKGDGSYLMPDDPVFQSIFNDIAAHRITVVAHLAEPTSCWQAPNPASPDYDYYKQHPGEYAYIHPGWPSKESILAARDHLLEIHPDLRVVGAHLGSMELDVDEVARRFDRYENFAVDTAARVPYLMLQPREKVRTFLIKYQDRVLYATDFGLQPHADTEKTLAGLRYAYAQEWRYFATNDHFSYAGRPVKGLGLPAGVLHKLYHDNALRWFPAMNVAPPAASAK